MTSNQFFTSIEDAAKQFTNLNTAEMNVAGNLTVGGTSTHTGNSTITGNLTIEGANLFGTNAAAGLDVQATAGNLTLQTTATGDDIDIQTLAGGGGTITLTSDGDLGLVSTTGGITMRSVLAGSIVSIDAPNLGSSLRLGASAPTINISHAAGRLGVFGDGPSPQQTPAIVAAAFVANSSGINDDTATFGGYTLGQIVTALTAYGLLQP